MQWIREENENPEGFVSMKKASYRGYMKNRTRYAARRMKTSNTIKIRPVCSSFPCNSSAYERCLRYASSSERSSFSSKLVFPSFIVWDAPYRRASYDPPPKQWSGKSEATHCAPHRHSHAHRPIRPPHTRSARDLPRPHAKSLRS